MPVASLEEAAIAAVRDSAVTVFSDWERWMKEGETIIPGPTLNRLVLTEGNGAFKLEVDKPGTYLVFEGCGEDPLHIHAGGSLVKPTWQADFHAAHEHSEDVTSVSSRESSTASGSTTG